MPQRQLDDVRFEEIVKILEYRARHLLEREARIGSTMPLTGKARIGDDELRERLLRLRRLIHQLIEGFGEYWREGGKRVLPDDIWSLLAAAEVSLNFPKLSTLMEAEVEVRLLNLWGELDALAHQVGGAVKLAMQDLSDDALALLTPEERLALQEMTSEELNVLGDLPPIDPELNQDIASVSSLWDSATQCRSETRAILAGRFHGDGGRGAPEKIRGQRFAVQLLGLSEGLDLFNTRNHGNNKSGIDAVIAAIQRCARIQNQEAPVLINEAPKTYDAFARRLLPKAREDERLLSEWRLGRDLGERIRQHRT